MHSSYTEHDGSAQLFVSATRRSELFGGAALTRTRGLASTSGGDTPGNVSWQVGTGFQQQIGDHPLWLRVEGTTSGNLDILSSRLVPRHSLNLGFNGQLTDRTAVGFNAYLYHSPTALGDGSDWITRSTLRVVHTVPTAAAASAALDAKRQARSKATGTIAGVVYVDWNRNGMADPDENALAGIRIRAAGRTAATGRDGRFRFSDVPVGLQEVSLDVSVLPVDFDPPDVNRVQTDLSKGDARQFRFGLIPLGSVRGKVVQDSNGTGTADDGDESVADAVVVLDGGTRSELVRNGRYRFDAVRSGEHTVSLLQESLPRGAKVATATDVRVALTREHPVQDVTFLIALDRREEIRRVFPEHRAARAASASPSPSASAVQRAEAKRGGTSRAARGPARAAGKAAAGSYSRSFIVQVAALRDETRARALAHDLQTAGFAAFVIDPDTSAATRLFRVRVGRYAERADAERSAQQLRRYGDGGRLWIVEQTPVRTESDR